MAYTPNTWAKGDTITSAKLNHIEAGVRYADEYVDRIKDAIDEKAPGIIITTEENESHEDLTNVERVTFVGNQLAFTNARYVTSKNILPKVENTWNVNGVDLVATDGFVTYNGTASNYSQTYLMLNQSIPTCGAGTYTFVIDMNANDPAHTRTLLRVIYDEGTPSYGDVVSNYYKNSSVVKFTVDRPFSKIQLSINVSKKTYDDYRLWLGLFKGDCEIIDAGLPVPQDENIIYSADGIRELTTIDTMQHDSIVRYIADTKKYVDNHIPDIKAYWTDEIYVLPEKFGAVGDGETDDSEALSDCLAYAKANSKAVRGYRKYKTSESIILDWRYADVYLREINYTGNDFAVEIRNQDIIFNFHRIVSSNAGVNFGYTSGKTAYAKQCQMTGNEIRCDENCIVAQPKTLYNVCEVKRLHSDNGDCIVFAENIDENDYPAGEYIFRSCKCHCPNGYVGKSINASQMYNFTVESDCKYGLLDPSYCVCDGWRHIEQTDGMWLRINGNSNCNNGPLIKFTKPSLDLYGHGYHNIIFVSSAQIPWYAIDCSAIQGYSSITGNVDNWVKYAYTGIGLGTSIAGKGDTGRDIIGNTMYIIGDNIVLVPQGRKMTNIDIPTCDFRLLDSRTDNDILYVANTLIKYIGTDFNISVPNVTVYLNSYFGAIGYNDLTVTQDNGNTATIYDKLGNVIFDGTTMGDGKWRLQCIMDRSSRGRYTGYNNTSPWWCYDGTNEVWEVTEIS